MRRGAAYAAIACLISGLAAAQDAPECFSPATHFNICEKARQFHAEMAAGLPMLLNSNITLSTAAVAGPRIIITALWNVTKESLAATLAANHTTSEVMAAKMQQFTENSICGQEPTGAFVRLGGQIQYLYKTRDGFIELSPVVVTCPPIKTISP